MSEVLLCTLNSKPTPTTRPKPQTRSGHQAAVGLSKKVFKDVLGHMYKTRMVSLGDEFVELLAEEEWREHWMAGAALDPKL